CWGGGFGEGGGLLLGFMGVFTSDEKPRSSAMGGPPAMNASSIRLSRSSSSVVRRCFERSTRRDLLPFPQPPGPNNIFIPAGGSANMTLKSGETARFQCCIHPWMHLTITPKDEHHVNVR